MLRLSPALFALCVLAACGKKEPAPVADAAPAPAADAAAPAPAAAAAPAADATAPTPAADAAPAAAADDAPAPDAAPAATDGAAYLVWIPMEGGYQTFWITAGPDGKPNTVADRPQAVLFGGGTMWGVEPGYLAYRETSCEDFNRMEDEPDHKATPGPKKHLGFLRARGLFGAKRGEALTLGAEKSDYFFGDPPKDGVWEMVGEHWGRTVSLDGGAGGLLFARDCEGAYGCGAHGDFGCGFQVQSFSGAEVPTDLGKALSELAPRTKTLFEEWTGDKVDESEEISEPGLVAFTLVANNGETGVHYLFTAEVPYSGTSGDWGSYTQSRDLSAPPVPGLGLPETPALVKAFLAPYGEAVIFGWSQVPADAAGALAAFKDSATLPAPKPADEAAAAGADAQAKVAEGRKLTRDKQYAEAIAAFDAAIAQSATHARAWSGRGYAKLLSGDAAGAQSDFEHALTLDSDAKFQAAIYFNLGEVAEAQKDKAKAIGHYQKALALNPSDAAKKRLEKLQAP